MSGLNHRQLAPTGVPYRQPGPRHLATNLFSTFGSLPVYKNVWRIRPGEGIVWAAAVPTNYTVSNIWVLPGDSRVHVAGSSGALGCLEAATGAVLWVSPNITYGVQRLFPHPAGGVIAVNIQRCMRIVDGNIIWSVPPPAFSGIRWGGAAVTANEVVLCVTDSGDTMQNSHVFLDLDGNQTAFMNGPTGGMVKLAGGDLIGNYWSTLRRWRPLTTYIWTNANLSNSEDSSLNQPVALSQDESRYLHARPHYTSSSNPAGHRMVQCFDTSTGALQWSCAPPYRTQALQASASRTVVSYGLNAHGINHANGQILWTRPDLGLVRNVNSLNQFLFAWPQPHTTQSGIPTFSGSIPSVQLADEAGNTLWSWESNLDTPNRGDRNIYDAAFYEGDIVAAGVASATWQTEV